MSEKKLSARADSSLSNPKLIQLLAQIEQNTRSEATAVLYKTREELGVKKTVVKLRATIYAITDIDNVRQEFTANLKIRARWKEPLLRDFDEKAEIDWDDQWNPRIELENAINVRNLDRKYRLKYFHDDTDGVPHVCLDLNISASFKEMFELEEFPLDYQALNIWLISEWPFEQLSLVKDDEYMDFLSVETFTESKEWVLYKQLISEPVGGPTDRDELYGSTEQYPLYSLTVQVKRRHAYYMWNHVMLMFLLFMVSLSTFSIDVAAVGERLTVSMLSLLAAIAYRIYIQRDLPQIAYWTALDKYNFAIVLTHFFIIMENSILGKLAQPGSIADLGMITRLDYGLTGAVVAIQLCVHAYFIAFAVQTHKKRDKFLEEETKNFEECNTEIEKRAKQRGPKRWKYEPAYENGIQSDATKETDIDSPRLKDRSRSRDVRRTQSLRFRRELPPTYNSRPLQPLPPMYHARAPMLPVHPARSGQAILVPAQHPALPTGAIARPVQANPRNVDVINPRQQTHEVSIQMNPSASPSRERQSRSTSRRRGSRNRIGVAASQSDTDA